MVPRTNARNATLLLLVLTVAGTVIPTVNAGSPNEPEMTDPADDVMVSFTVPAPKEAAAQLDFLAIWIDGETATTFNVTFQMRDLAASEDFEADPAYSAQYELDVRLASSNQTYGFYASNSGVLYGAGWEFLLRPEDGDSVDVQGSADLPSSRITFTVPKAAIGLPLVGDRILFSEVVSWASFAYGDPQWQDRGEAPDGTAYTFAVGPAQENASAEADAPPSSQPTQKPGPTSQPPSSPTPTATPAAEPSASGGSAGTPLARDLPTKDTPGPGAMSVLIAFAIGLGLWLRRNSAG